MRKLFAVCLFSISLQVALFAPFVCKPAAAQSATANAVNKAIVVNNVAELSQLGTNGIPKPVDGQLVHTSGYYVPGDGGGNFYRYVSTSTDTVNGGFVIDGPGSVGRYVALNQTVAQVLQFGAIDDGSAPTDAHFQAAIDACKTVYVPEGTYEFDTGVTVVDYSNYDIYGDSVATWDDNNPHDESKSLIVAADGFTGALFTFTTNAASPIGAKRSFALRKLDLVLSDSGTPGNPGTGVLVTRGAGDTGSYGGFRMSEVSISNGDIGFHIDYGTGTYQALVVEQCRIEKNNFGIVVDGTLTTSRIVSSIIRQNNFAETGTDYVSFTGGGIHLNGRGPGVFVDGSSGVTIQDCDLEGQQVGIFARRPNGLNIHSNYFEASRTCSISIAGGRSVDIRGNQIGVEETHPNAEIYLEQCEDVSVFANVDAHLLMGPYNINVDTDNWGNSRWTSSNISSLTVNNSGFMLTEVGELGRRVSNSQARYLRSNSFAANSTTLAESVEPGPFGEIGKVLEQTSPGAFNVATWNWNASFAVQEGDYVVSGVYVRLPESNATTNFRLVRDELDQTIGGTSSDHLWDTEGYLQRGQWYLLQWVYRVQTGETSWRRSLRLGTLVAGDHIETYGAVTNVAHAPNLNAEKHDILLPVSGDRVTRTGGNTYIGHAAPGELTWSQGDIVQRFLPVAGGKVGWIEVGGSFKEFGSIDP